MRDLIESIESRRRTSGLRESRSTKDARMGMKAMESAARGAGKVTAWAEDDDAYMEVEVGGKSVSFSYYASGAGGTIYATQMMEEVRGKQWEAEVKTSQDIKKFVQMVLRKSKGWLGESVDLAESDAFMSRIGEKIGSAVYDLSADAAEAKDRYNRLSKKRDELEAAWKKWDLRKLVSLGAISRKEADQIKKLKDET